MSISEFWALHAQRIYYAHFMLAICFRASCAAIISQKVSSAVLTCNVATQSGICPTEDAFFKSLQLRHTHTKVNIHCKNFPKRYAWLSVTFLGFISFEQLAGNNWFGPWKRSWFQEFSWFKWVNVLFLSFIYISWIDLVE